MALLIPSPNPCLLPHQTPQTFLSTPINTQAPANYLTHCPGPCFFPLQLPKPLLRAAQGPAFVPAEPLPAAGSYSCCYLFFCPISQTLLCSLLPCLPHQTCRYPFSLVAHPIPHFPALVPLQPPPPPHAYPCWIMFLKVRRQAIVGTSCQQVSFLHLGEGHISIWLRVQSSLLPTYLLQKPCFQSGCSPSHHSLGSPSLSCHSCCPFLSQVSNCSLFWR